MTTTDRQAIEDYAGQAREFLSKARVYVQNDDLHQASEKAWGAAAHMARAVANANGWQYQTHSDFVTIIRNASELSGNERLRFLRGVATELRGNYDQRKRFLNGEEITADIESVAEMLEILEPLTE